MTKYCEKPIGEWYVSSCFRCWWQKQFHFFFTCGLATGRRTLLVYHSKILSGYFQNFRSLVAWLLARAFVPNHLNFLIGSIFMGPERHWKTHRSTLCITTLAQLELELSVALVVEIPIWNGAFDNNASIQTTSTHSIDYDPRYTAEDDEEPTAAGKHRVSFTVHASMHKMGEISSARTYSA